MKTPHRYDEGAAGILRQSPLLFEALSKLFRASFGVQSEFVRENVSLSSLNRRELSTVLSPFFHRYFTADPIFGVRSAFIWQGSRSTGGKLFHASFSLHSLTMGEFAGSSPLHYLISLVRLPASW